MTATRCVGWTWATTGYRRPVRSARIPRTSNRRTPKAAGRTTLLNGQRSSSAKHPASRVVLAPTAWWAPVERAEVRSRDAVGYSTDLALAGWRRPLVAVFTRAWPSSRGRRCHMVRSPVALPAEHRRQVVSEPDGRLARHIPATTERVRRSIRTPSSRRTMQGQRTRRSVAATMVVVSLAGLNTCSGSSASRKGTTSTVANKSRRRPPTCRVCGPGRWRPSPSTATSSVGCCPGRR